MPAPCVSGAGCLALIVLGQFTILTEPLSAEVTLETLFAFVSRALVSGQIITSTELLSTDIASVNDVPVVGAFRHCFTAGRSGASSE